jgi:hypothetical protein
MVVDWVVANITRITGCDNFAISADWAVTPCSLGGK